LPCWQWLAGFEFSIRVSKGEGGESQVGRE